MSRFVIYLFILILNAFIALKAQSSALVQNKKVPVLELKGSPYEIGFQHGSKLKKEIAEVYAKWKESVRTDTKKDPDEVIKHFLETSRYKEAVMQWTPNIYEELKGIADGSGQSFDDVFAFQLIDEYWGYLDRLEHNSVDKDHCSAIGIAKNKKQPTIVAENIDIDSFMNGYQVLLHIKQSKETPEQYLMTCAGFLGFAGMNRHVSLVINALTDLNNSVTGLPVAFVTRGVLEKKSGEEALNFLKNVKHATGQNYLLGTENQVYSFEASANDVIEFKPFDNNLLVYHTNHSLVNHDVKPWMKDFHQRVLAGQGKKGNSQTRMESLESQINKMKETLDQEKIKNILRSKESPIFPICVTYKEGATSFTFSSVIFTLGKKPYAEVTYGSPDQSEYQKHYFD